MKARGLKSLRIYPEGREWQRRTAEQVLDQFDGLERNRLLQLNQPERIVWDPLANVWRQVLEFLGIYRANDGQ